MQFKLLPSTPSFAEEAHTEQKMDKACCAFKSCAGIKSDSLHKHASSAGFTRRTPIFLAMDSNGLFKPLKINSMNTLCARVCIDVI